MTTTFKQYISASFLALFTYVLLLYLLIHLNISGYEPVPPLIDILPVVLMIAVPAVVSFVFLIKVHMSGINFVLISIVTTLLASNAWYMIATRDCTPTTCEEGVVWFFITGLFILGFLLGAIIYALKNRNP